MILGVPNRSAKRSELRVPCQPPARAVWAFALRERFSVPQRAHTSSGGSVSAGSELPASGWTRMTFGGAHGRLPREPEDETYQKTVAFDPPPNLAP